MNAPSESALESDRRNFLILACAGVAVPRPVAMPDLTCEFVVRAKGAERAKLVTERVVAELTRMPDRVSQCTGRGTVSINTAPGTMRLWEAKQVVNAVRNSTSLGERFEYRTCYDINRGDQMEVMVSLTSKRA